MNNHPLYPLYPLQPLQPIQPIQPLQPLQPLSGLRSTHDIIGLINTLLARDIMIENTTDITENSIRCASEVFLNNLDEFTVDSEFANKEVQCSICLDEFKEGDKCIRLPCEGEPHIFHSGSDSCSGIRPWLERNNTCPMCRHEFPTDNQHVIPPVIPPSLVPTSNITLTPGQIAGLAYSNIDNVVPDMNDNNIIGEQNPENIPNPNSLENTISDMIEAYIRNMDRLPNGLMTDLMTGLPAGLMTEDNDLQRAIELSLNDIS